jgi:hypothetical protein
VEEVWYDGVDQDCDDHDDYDADEDNRRAVEYGGDDCDDTDERVNPGQAERCDDKDNDCDSQVDENAVDGVVYFQDSDGDGYGNEDSRSKFCEAPEGYTSDRTDCDDTNAAISPGAEETWYDGLDQDCNAASDYDADEDGYDGVEWGGADCDDTDPVKYPRTWYLDVDEDGYGTSADSISTCDAPANYVAEATDCDDDDPLVSPGATEVCGDGQDNNCDSDAPGCGVVGPLGPSDAWVTLTGEATRDHVGISAAKGDFDGDGLLDLVFGADQNDRGGNYSGSIYVMNAPYIDGSYSAGSASGIVYGPDEYAGFGQSIASVGDIDGDGYDDLLVGAPDHDTGTGIGSGSAWLIPGPIVGTSAATALSTYWLGELSSADAGEALAGGQDVDGDGNPDIAIGASQDDRAGTSSGAVYIFGDSGLGTTSLTEASHLLLGASPAEQLGAALVQGDLDADGVPELVVGAAGYEGTGAALIYARPLPTAGAADDADAVMMGEASGDSAGKVLTICADADDDGYAELLVGAPDADSSGVDSGSAYALSGYAAGSSDLAEAPWLIRSASPGDEVGAALACAGDVEGDGQPDLLVGAPSAGTQGQVFLMPFGAGTTVVSSALATITGESSGDGMGSSVVGLGDMDLDGDDEIGMGAWRANTTGTDAGALYVMLGGPGL